MIRVGPHRGLRRQIQGLWVQYRLKSGGFSYTQDHARSLGVRVGEEARLYCGISWGSEPWLIEVGPRTWITGGVAFYTHDGSHAVLPRAPGQSFNAYGRIIIGADCFIGQHAILLRGVHVGDRCIVGAGSVVTKSIPAGHVVAGNPARIVRTVDQLAERIAADTLDLPTTWHDAESWRSALESAVPFPVPAEPPRDSSRTDFATPWWSDNSRALS